MILPAGFAGEILAHCIAALPNEACGLLAGDEAGVRRVYPVANTQASPVAYTIDPTGHFGALQDAGANGWDLVGAFHSHVSSAAYPSPTDRAGAAEPDWVWLIAGPMRSQPVLRAFRIREGVVFEEELEIVGG